MPVLGPRLRNLQTVGLLIYNEPDYRANARQKLLAIRVGSGAIKLPKDVARIHLRFAQKNANGHMAPRKFWHHELVRMKYHNPAVSITTDRTMPNTEEPVMTVFFAPNDAPKTSGTQTGGPNPTTSTSGDKVASEHASFEKTETIPMKDRQAKKILEDLIRITKAEEIRPSDEDTAMLADLAEQVRRSQLDRDMVNQVKAEKKRQEDILKAARGAA